jgi:hypothetical protein
VERRARAVLTRWEQESARSLRPLELEGFELFVELLALFAEAGAPAGVGEDVGVGEGRVDFLDAGLDLLDAGLELLGLQRRASSFLRASSARRRERSASSRRRRVSASRAASSFTRDWCFSCHWV